MHALTVASPDSNVKLEFRLTAESGTEGVPVYRVYYKGTPLLLDSWLGLRLEGQPHLLNGFTISSHYYESKDEEWRPVYGERNRVLDRFNELTVVLSEQSNRGRELRIVFRAYNEGVAFRYELPEKPYAPKELIIVGERSQFHFPEGCLAYEHQGAEGEYHLVPVGELQRNCERPLTVVYPNGSYASLTEAAMNDYARMLLEAENGIVVSQLSGLVTEYVGYDNMDTNLEGKWADETVSCLAAVRIAMAGAHCWR